jgi:hypothetical protein
MDENKVDESVVRNRQERQFLARGEMAQHCPAYEIISRRGHCGLDECDST